MSILDKLWDDTVAGPLPDTGLGYLRRPIDLSIRTTLCKDVEGSLQPEEDRRVTRSILLRKPTASSSPTTSPLSPYSGSGGRRDWKRFRGKKTVADAEGGRIGG